MYLECLKNKRKLSESICANLLDADGNDKTVFESNVWIWASHCLLVLYYLSISSNLKPIPTDSLKLPCHRPWRRGAFLISAFPSASDVWQKCHGPHHCHSCALSHRVTRRIYATATRAKTRYCVNHGIFPRVKFLLTLYHTKIMTMTCCATVTFASMKYSVSHATSHLVHRVRFPLSLQCRRAWQK